MGAETNGKPKGSHSKMNGQPNGASTGRSSRARRKSKTTYTGWVIDKGLKVLVWYTIITLAFRCPKTTDQITDTSPRICKPNLQVKEFVQPHLQPYYQQYVDPYVQRAQPYVDQVNEKVYKPGLIAYEQYGAPRVTQAQKYGQQQWETTIRPQLDVARQQAGKQYDAALAPHVKKVQDVVQPYYDTVKTSASDIWELEIQPVYKKTSPYAQKIYTQGQDFAVNTALPQAQYASNTAWSLWTRHVWPRIRVLYGENVEPQLHRITERLARYKDGKRLEAEIKSMESESKASEASSKVESVVSSISSTVTEATESPSSAASAATAKEPESTVTPTEQFRGDLKSWEAICAKAVDEGAEDLKERIQDITGHQTTSQAEGVGNALVIQLEETSVGVFNSVKARIQAIVSAIPEDASDARLEEANEDLALATRAAGQNVKKSAQAIRDWHQTYKSELNTLVNKALQSTLETIDGIRDLRLTEIGRRYADKELPHKEWSKYNDLKKATQSWRDDVEKASKEHAGIKSALEAGEDVESRGMKVAEESAKELGRLKEVGRWKIAADDASDDFDTKYTPAAAERARKRVVEKVEDAKEGVIGSEQGTVDSATSVASEKASEMASSASASAENASKKAKEAVGASEKPAAESAASEAKKFASSAAQKASEAVVGGTQASAESASSKAKSSASSAASRASEAAVGGDQPAVESATNKARVSASSASSAASQAVVGSSSGISDSATDAASKASEQAMDSDTGIPQGISKSLSAMIEENAGSQTLGPKAASILSEGKAKKEAASKSAASGGSEASASAQDVIDEISSSVSSAAAEAFSSGSSLTHEASATASSGSRKVFAGANAQVIVEAREPILDDVVDDDAAFSERVQAMVDGVKDQASYLTQVVEDAFKPVTSTQGSVESVTSLASEQYESAMAAASSVLFGTQDSIVEKGSEAARMQYLSAVTA